VTSALRLRTVADRASLRSGEAIARPARQSGRPKHQRRIRDHVKHQAAECLFYTWTRCLVASDASTARTVEITAGGIGSSWSEDKVQGRRWRQRPGRRSRRGWRRRRPQRQWQPGSGSGDSIEAEPDQRSTRCCSDVRAVITPSPAAQVQIGRCRCSHDTPSPCRMPRSGTGTEESDPGSQRSNRLVGCAEARIARHLGQMQRFTAPPRITSFDSLCRRGGGRMPFSDGYSLARDESLLETSCCRCLESTLGPIPCCKHESCVLRSLIIRSARYISSRNAIAFD
jgi:hypothetical protein